MAYEEDIEVVDAPEEEEEVDVDPTVDVPPEDFLYDEDELNLAPVFMDHPDGEKALREISEKVMDDFESAWESCEGYRERKAQDWKLFTGELPSKTFPFANCANAHIPIMLENISRLSFRMTSEVFGDYTNVYSFVPTGPDDREAAEALSIHGNWQLREGIPDFIRQMDRAMLSYTAWGDVTSHSYWDDFEKCNRHEVLTTDDFVIPYVHVSTAPDYSDVPFMVKILHRHRHQLESKRNIWFDVDKVLDSEPPSWDSDPESLLRESVAQTNQLDPPDSKSGAPYKLLHYEGWCSLPNQEKERFVQVILDYETRAILSLSIHEEVNAEDNDRYERQLEELNRYRDMVDQRSDIIEQMREQEDAIRAQVAEAPGVPPEGASAIIEQMSQAPLPPEPVPPGWMIDPEDTTEEPTPPQKRPIHMFSHGVCIENMLGSLGLSFGRIQADLNGAANEMANQFIDSSTLANITSYIVPDTLDVPDMLNLTPGAVNKIGGVTAQELKNSIIEMKASPANSQLMQMVDKMYEWGQSSVQAPGVLSGEAGKSGETFRGLATRVEQATKQLSVSARKFSNTFLKQLLKNNAKLNSVFLPEDEMLQLMDWKANQMRTIQIGRHLYAKPYTVRIESDLRFTSQAQKIQEAQDLMMLPGQIPALQGNLPFIQAATKKYLEAREQYDMVPFLGPEIPPPQTPMGVPAPQPPATPGQPQTQPNGSPTPSQQG